MAGSSLLALIDDIATLLDDVAVMTKTATGKTAGVLGDDLALNANQLTGIRAQRELPVVWAVAKGSLVNKAILVPAALLISAILPAAITPLLVAGGLYLCFEGFEKVAHKILHHADQAGEHQQMLAAAKRSAQDLVAFEKNKIRGAIRTDFILSAEIIVITLGTVAESEFMTRVIVLCLVALLITAGVYGLVAAIIKMDDAGLYLRQKSGAVRQALGRGLLLAAPRLMKALSVLGTAAMFLVGGGILVHGVGPLHHVLHALKESALHATTGVLTEPLFAAVCGVLAGGIIVAVVQLGNKVRKTMVSSA